MWLKQGDGSEWTFLWRFSNEIIFFTCKNRNLIDGLFYVIESFLFCVCNVILLTKQAKTNQEKNYQNVHYTTNRDKPEKKDLKYKK